LPEILTFDVDGNVQEDNFEFPEELSARSMTLSEVGLEKEADYMRDEGLIVRNALRASGSTNPARDEDFKYVLYAVIVDCNNSFGLI